VAEPALLALTLITIAIAGGAKLLLS